MSLYANVDGDEVLLEAAQCYSEEFVKDGMFEGTVMADAVQAIFLDGARWAIKNRMSGNGEESSE